MADKTKPPIIVKKIKKGGHGHHGGAWKVAYADFVTAMMAFFLLLWLLNAVESDKLQGLADYFAPTLGIKDEAGIGFKGGKGPISKGVGADKNTNKGIIFGAPRPGAIIRETLEPEDIIEDSVEEKIEISAEDKSAEDEAEEEVFEQVEDTIRRRVEENPEVREFEGNVDIRQVPEGLEIQLVDKDGKTMFKEGSAELTPHAEKLLTELGGVVSLLPNFLSITGHTNSIKSKNGGNYTNWELSSDRAHSARRVLVSAGVLSDQVAKVIGKSDQEPYNSDNPDSPSNNRVSIIVLRHSRQAYHKKSSPDAVFVDPNISKTDEYYAIKPGEKAQIKQKALDDKKALIEGAKQQEIPLPDPEVREVDEKIVEKERRDIILQGPAQDQAPAGVFSISPPEPEKPVVEEEDKLEPVYEVPSFDIIPEDEQQQKEQTLEESPFKVSPLDGGDGGVDLRGLLPPLDGPDPRQKKNKEGAEKEQVPEVPGYETPSFKVEPVQEGGGFLTEGDVSGGGADKAAPDDILSPSQ